QPESGLEDGDPDDDQQQRLSELVKQPLHSRSPNLVRVRPSQRRYFRDYSCHEASPATADRIRIRGVARPIALNVPASTKYPANDRKRQDKISPASAGRASSEHVGGD